MSHNTPHQGVVPPKGAGPDVCTPPFDNWEHFTMYKDKLKQREANRLAKRRQRAKGMTKGMTGMTSGITAKVSPNTSKVWNHHSEPNAQKAVVGKLTVNPQSYNPMMVGYVPPRAVK